MVAAACAALGVLAAYSLSLSDLPAWLAWPCGVAATVRGAQLALRELARRPLDLIVTADASASVGGAPVQALRIRWRGPLAFLRWRDAVGRTRRRVLTPDVLSSASRRELRLVGGARPATRRDAAVAP